MTAATAARATQPWAGTGALLRAGLRRDRRRLAVWVLAAGLVTVYAAVALGTVYPTAADRLARAAVIDTPAGVVLSGPGYGVEEGYPLGAMIANELTLSVVVAVAIMSIQAVVRHTRAQEEDGAAELVLAGAVGRRAPLTAALLLAGLADAAVALVVAAGLVGSGLAVRDSLALGVAIGLTGLVFGSVAAVSAQLTAHARAATGLALAVLAGAAVVRGVGDLLRTGGSALSWSSPIAWAQQTRAFVDLRWTPLLLSVALLAALTALAARLAAGRDLGAGLVPPQPGPATASGLLSGAAGLAVRLQRATVTAWAVALLLLGVVFGSLADAVAGMVEENEQLAAVLGPRGGASLTDSFLAATALYLALCAAGFAVASVLRLRAEESAGRAELLLSTGVSRGRWLGGGLLVTAAASALLLTAAGLGTGAAAAAVRGDAGLLLPQVGAQLAHLPAVLVVAALAAALVGLVPRLAALAWAVVVWVVVAGFFGELLGFPGWLRRLSPFDWVPGLPAETLTVAAPAGLVLLVTALVLVALAGVRRRDVPA
ncbi:ABC transporter permease [Geodermatophilus sp. SYSU D00697]